MKRLSPRELILLCLPLLFLAGAGFLVSRRDPLDVSRVSLLLDVSAPTNMESLDGAGAALSVALQGPQASRWKLLSINPHLQLETPQGTLDSLSSPVPWRYSWIRGSTETRMLADLTRVPPGKLRYVCEAYIVSKEHPNDKPKRLSQSWPLNRAALLPLWAGKPRRPALGISKFTITRVGSQMWRGKKRPVVEGELDFIVQKGAGLTLDVSPNSSRFGVKYSVSPPLSSTTVGGKAFFHQAFSLELGKQFVAARRLKIPVRVSGRANTGGCWPLAFQVEPFDFDKVKAGQQLNFKSWPVPRPTP